MNWTPLIIHKDRRAFILNLLLIYEFWSTEIILINIHIVPSLDSEIFKLTPESFCEDLIDFDIFLTIWNNKMF